MGARARLAAALAVIATVLASAIAFGEGAPKGAPAEGLDCGELMSCSDECGRKCSGISKFGCLMGCRDGCSRRGCAEASRAFDTLTDCIKGHCPFACAGGPSERCLRCSLEGCSGPRNACLSQRCSGPGGAGGADAGAAAPAGAASQDGGR